MERIHIKPTDRVFVLTGAGMSAESGIPTFRDSNGLWRNYRIEEVASPEAWRRDPQLVWDFYSMRRTVAAVAQPNPGHRALAALEDTLGSRLFLCTQNVDNLPSRPDPVRSTCTASCSRVGASAVNCPSMTRISITRSRFAHVVERSARTFAGSQKGRLGWIVSSAPWKSARSSLRSGLLGWSSLQQVSSDRPKPGRSTSARKSRSTSRLSTRRSQAKPASCCLRCST